MPIGNLIKILYGATEMAYVISMLLPNHFRVNKDTNPSCCLMDAGIVESLFGITETVSVAAA